MDEIKKEDFEILEEVGDFSKRLKKEILKFSKTTFCDFDIIDFVERKIFDKGYLPAFPCMVCINEIAAHKTIFEEKTYFKKSDLVTVDFGVSFKGLICDTAITFEIETNTHKKLIDTTKKVLERVCENILVGTKMNEIGKIVEDGAKKNNFNTIHNLSGHQISKYNLHCGLNVPNYDNQNSSEITNNTIFAIEPFLTYGENRVCDFSNSNILTLKKDFQVRDPIGKKILNYIRENYSNLPFSKRWLTKDFVESIKSENFGFSKKEVVYGIEVLKRAKIIFEYPILKTIDNKCVCQFEHTAVFYDNKKYIIS